MSDASSSSSAWLTPYRDRLGIDTDVTIAKELGLPFSAALSMVSEARINLGIPRAPHDPSVPIPAWLEPVIDAVGVEADADLARRVGVSVSALRVQRIRLGHGAPRPQRSQIEGLRSLLGTVPDETIAARLGVPRNVVQYHRRNLGIKAYVRQKGEQRLETSSAPSTSAWPRPSSPLPDWLLPYADQIGVLSDAEIARKTGRSREMIRLYRTARGTPKAPSDPDLSPILDRLGTVSDAILAAEIGVGVLRIRVARTERGILPPLRTPKPGPAGSALVPFLHLFGVRSDREIAKDAKVGLGTVIRMRLKLGIAPPPRENRLPLGEGTRRLAPFLDKLGVWSDMEIARRADVHVSSVVQVRRRRGIPPAPRGTTRPLQFRDAP